MWEWAKKVHINENELRNNWLLSQDSRGTAWHLAALRGHITVLKKLWDWATEMNLNLKEDLLLVRDISGRTAGHLAAEMGNTGTLEEILHWVKEAKLNFEDDLLLAKDRNGQTPLELLKECLFISEDKKAELLQKWSRYLPDA
jgi:ankyrin repeat protein